MILLGRRRPIRSTACAPSTAAATTTSSGRSTTTSCSRGSAPCCAGRAPPEPERLEAGGSTIDRPTRRVTVAGERVLLPAKEYELLVKLASDPHRVFTKDELLRDVWGFRSHGRTRTLDSHASRLRRKLDADPAAAPYVRNVWGVGYCLLGDSLIPRISILRMTRYED